MVLEAGKSNMKMSTFSWDLLATLSHDLRCHIEGLKDRPQEVKETLLLPRKCLFTSERHLCHQAMQIGYKTHSPH
jgi:hypothetical protein